MVVLGKLALCLSLSACVIVVVTAGSSGRPHAAQARMRARVPSDASMHACLCMSI